LPEMVEASVGRNVPYGKSSYGKLGMRKLRSKDKQIGFYTSFGGKTKRLGVTEDVAKDKLKELEIEQEKIDLSRKSLVKQNFIDLLSRRGFSLSYSDLDSSYRGIAPSIYGYGVIVIPDLMTDRNETVRSIASLYFMREILNDINYRLVICCYVEDALPKVVSLAKQLGIEFLTPDELVASLKGSEADGQGEPR
jgi:hypothetical protein